MSIFDDNINIIEITKEDIQDASASSNNLDERIQKRAFANVLGARIGIRFLQVLGFNSSNYESLYTIPSVLKDLDISDICLNNIKIDVRIVPDETKLCIPKSQFEFCVTPDIYIFFKLSSDFSTAEFIGAISPEEISKEVENKDYYFISNSNLYNSNSLKTVLTKKKPESHVLPSENDIVKAEAYIVNFIDGDIKNNEKHHVYNMLMQSNDLRLMLKDFEHFELISNDLAHTDELLNDSVLNVLGAQAIYQNDFSDGNFAADVNLDELADETVADFVEGFVDEESNNIEDAFETFAPEDVIEGEFTELPNEDNSLEDFSSEVGELEELPSDEELASFEMKEIEDIEQGEEINFEDNLENFEEIVGIEQNNENNFDNNLENFEEIEEDNTINNNDNELNNMEENNNLNESESNFAEFEELTLDNDEDNNFEIVDNQDFQLEEVVNNEDISFEDLTLDNSENLEEISFDDIQNAFNEPEVLNETPEVLEELSPLEQTNEDILVENSSDDFSLEEFNENANIGDITNTDNMEDFANFEEISADNDTNSELTENNGDIDFSQVEDLTLDTDNLEDFNLEEIVDTNNELEEFTSTNEVTDGIETDNTQTDEIPVLGTLEEFDAPIDLELPNLDTQDFQLNDLQTEEPIEDIQQETLESIESIDSVEPIEEIAPVSNIDDISTDINFEELGEQTLDVPDLENDFSELEDLSSSDEHIEEVDLSNFEMIDAGAEPTPHEPVEEITEQEIISDSAENYSDEDFSGLEEFTMDMASEVENTPQEEHPMELNDIEQFSQNIDMANEETNFDNVNFADDTSNNQDLVSLDSFNLDDLDEESSQSDINLDNLDLDSEIDNLVNSDIDMSELNLDDIDLNDPDLVNLDLENDLNDFNDPNSLNNIPDATNMAYNNMPQQEYAEQQPYMQEQQMAGMEQNMGMNMGDPNYNPDFANNDQSTIQALYENNPQGQPSQSMDQSLNNNNVQSAGKKQKAKKGKTSPLLGILLLVLVGALIYMQKDMIMDKINQAKGVTVTEDQNMPNEGETSENKQDEALLADNQQTNPEEEEKQGVGAMPGEAGGPQNAEQMEASLHQRGSNANQPISAISKVPEALSSSNIRKLSWEIPQDLSYNDSIVRFLKVSGKTMKLSMQNDLLNVTEMPYSTKMIVDVVIKKDGTFNDPVVTVSSGSKQIDNIVLQSVKETLKYVKAPTSEFKKDSYDFSIIIIF